MISLYRVKFITATCVIISMLACLLVSCGKTDQTQEPDAEGKADTQYAIDIMTESETRAQESDSGGSSDEDMIISDNPNDNTEKGEHEGEMKTKYDKHGALHVNNNGKLVDHNGEVVALHGYSTHGINLYPGYINREFLEYLRDDWHIDIIRLAMYTAEQNGYCISGDENKAELMDVIDRGVKAATELGLYVIIDWHILSDSNPNIHADQAIDFFDKVSSKYSSYGNVFYEICNEPNSGCSWDDIRSYADRVIPVIRKNDPYSVILVGTPNWSQRVDEAVANPITSDDNLMYVLHFYADTHRDDLRNICKDALNAKLPIFVTEFGTCAADGNGGHNKEESDKWIKLLDENQISYVMWNISNKNETSAMLVPECDNVKGHYSDDDLREPAKWFREVLAKDGNN
ncbi:MAG: glycoside hydrolase family 5 protein [Lachnospiraceae bacterium]|nr:glycoside hydrolase family 5 protein [Lachnospiraceae bacterium]